MLTLSVCVIVLLALAGGLAFSRMIDWLIQSLAPGSGFGARSTLETLLIGCACNTWFFCGIGAVFAWAGITLALLPIFYGAYCLVKYRPHWFTIWSVFKAVFAVAIFPFVLLVFWLDKQGFVSLMSALWPHIDIYTPEGELYLRRWFMTPKGQKFRPRFLHLILLSDEGRDPHDHPGAFSTTILMNGYDEEIYLPKSYVIDEDNRWYGRPGFPLMREVRAGHTFDNPEDHTHIVKLIGPTLTWVVGWKKGRKWGFWKMDRLDPSKDVWVESEEYGEKGDERKSWTIDGK